MTSNFFVLAVLIVLLFGASSAVWAQLGTGLSRDFVHITGTENLDLSKGLTARVAANPAAFEANAGDKIVEIVPHQYLSTE